VARTGEFARFGESARTADDVREGVPRFGDLDFAGDEEFELLRLLVLFRVIPSPEDSNISDFDEFISNIGVLDLPVGLLLCAILSATFDLVLLLDIIYLAK
jgi:hypothetical protein